MTHRTALPAPGRPVLYDESMSEVSESSRAVVTAPRTPVRRGLRLLGLLVALCALMAALVTSDALAAHPVAQVRPDLAAQLDAARTALDTHRQAAEGELTALQGSPDAAPLPDGLVDTNPDGVYLSPDDAAAGALRAALNQAALLGQEALACLDPQVTVVGSTHKADWPHPGMTQVTPAEIETLTADVDRAADQVEQAVATAESAWAHEVVASALAGRDAAKAARDDAVAQANQVLAATDGQVADPATRAALQAAVDAAVATPALTRDDGVTPVSAILAEAAALAIAPDALAQASQAVADSKAAWDKAQAEAKAKADAEAKAKAKGPAATRPNPAGYTGHWIEVDLSEQKVYLRDGDTVVRTFTASTGKKGCETPIGTFAVQAKIPVMTYSGHRPGEAPYNLPNVRWNTQFLGPYLIHTAYWHNSFGTPVSHGCVNLREADAKVLYDFVVVGTPVVVHA